MGLFQPLWNPPQEWPQVLGTLDKPSLASGIPKRSEAFCFIFFFVGNLQIYSQGVSPQRLVVKDESDCVQAHPRGMLKQAFRYAAHKGRVLSFI